MEEIPISAEEHKNYRGSFVAEEQKQIKAEIKTRISQLSLMVQ